jgi:magnesium chelatase family protein
MDRIDMALYVGPVGYEKLSRGDGAPESEAIRKKVRDARMRAHARARDAGLIGKLNGNLRVKELRKMLLIEPPAEKLLNESAERLLLSGRAYHRTQKLARTIADLDGSDTIKNEHVLEAIRYRPQFDS